MNIDSQFVAGHSWPRGAGTTGAAVSVAQEARVLGDESYWGCVLGHSELGTDTMLTPVLPSSLPQPRGNTSDLSQGGNPSVCAHHSRSNVPISLDLQKDLKETSQDNGGSFLALDPKLRKPDMERSKPTPSHM